MIWQVPEVWEILKIMEIAGLTLTVSFPSFVVSLIIITLKVSFIRQQENSVSNKTKLVLDYFLGCFVRSGKITIASILCWTFCLFLLPMHPDILSVSIL